MSKAGLIVGAIAAIGFGAIIGWAVTYYAFCGKSEGTSSSGSSKYTSEGTYSQAAVVTDAANCSKVGRDILKKGGTAVDGAISSMLCVGVINMHSVGIGGGGVMLVYNRTERKAHVVNFREVAPSNATRDMFVKNPDHAKFGGRAIAVPGEVRGYYTAWKRFGRLPWKELVQPAIDIARMGFSIGKPVYETMVDMEKKLREIKDPGLRELLFDENNELRQENEVITNLKYAATLEMVRDDPQGFYTGELAKNIVRDMGVVDEGGLVTAEDLKNYHANVTGALENKMGPLNMYMTPAPTSGPVIALILNIVKGYNMTKADRNLKHINASALTFHRIIEAFKFAYAWRTRLADPAFVPNVTKVTEEMLKQSTADYLRSRIWDNQTHHVDYYADFYVNVDHGTSHLSVLDPDGNAVSLTTTINLRFGCLYRSTSTGIIYNNQMYDFDNPSNPKIAGLYPSTLNFPAPGKRPLSSVTPLIFTDNEGNVKLVVGASGGKKIITASSLVVLNKLFFGRSLFEAIDDPRVHNHLVPNNTVRIEKYGNDSQYTLPKEIQERLIARGHEVEYSKYYAAVQGIYHAGTKIYAKSDPRKHGSPAGF